MAADRRKQIEGAIAALGSLRSAVESEQSRILDEVVALLASLDGELASLSAKLRWHASAPLRQGRSSGVSGGSGWGQLASATALGYPEAR